MYQGHFKEDKREGYGKLYKIGRRSHSESEKMREEKLIYEGMWVKGK